jgi:DNA invertase Pin-like site-specific DNA recombinase
MKVAIYVRISTDKQELKNQLLQLKQFTQIKKQCLKKGDAT